MNLLNSIVTALSNLRANKLRSTLTMLGVIIGVSAVIVIVGLVEGAKSKVVQEFERLGSQLILVVYQPNQDDIKKMKRRIDGLTMEDVDAIRAECELVRGISAELPPGELTARYRDRDMKVNANGVQPDFQHLRNVTLASGRFLSEEDIEEWTKVCVLGSKVKQELFGKEDPIGSDIEIQGVAVTVVGVLEAKGRIGNSDEDKTVLLPITSIQKRFVGSDIVGIIWAQPKDPAMIDAAMDEIWECLMRRYENAPGFRIDSQQNILGAIGRILNIFGMVLGGVAGLALLVGGIGIMNIMLVSVTERTREIGIRKAVGARRRDILLQFLIESATLSGVGGLAGIALGALEAFAISEITARFMSGGVMGPGGEPGFPVHLPVWSIAIAFGFSAFVGIFFGIYPALRASSLDPIQALRHE